MHNGESHPRTLGPSFVALAICALFLLGLATTVNSALTHQYRGASGVGRRGLVQLTPKAAPGEEGDRERKQLFVEFAEAGHMIPLHDALDLTLPLFPFESEQMQGVAVSVSRSDPADPPPADDPGSIDELSDIDVELQQVPNVTTADQDPGSDDARFFIAVMSTCCDVESRRKRESIRESWMKKTLQDFPGRVQIRFILAQPAQPLSSEDLQALEMEIAASSDLVFIRGVEAYERLALKTFATLRYFLSPSLQSPQFTHLVKVDDDWYVALFLSPIPLKFHSKLFKIDNFRQFSISLLFHWA